MRTLTVSALALFAGASIAAAQSSTTPSQPGPGTMPNQQPQHDWSHQGGNDPSNTGRPGIGRMGQPGSTMDPQQVIAAWPAKQQEAYRTLSQKFGPPDDVSTGAICWRDKGNFKKIAIEKESVQHLFPQPHEDFLEVCISSKVPAEKVSDLSKFDGSISVNRTKGTMSVTCDKLEDDILALNLAHDIITDKISVDQARQQLAKEAVAVAGGQTPQLAQDLQFRPDLAAADPDQTARTLASPEAVPGSGGEKSIDKDKDDKNNPGGGQR